MALLSWIGKTNKIIWGVLVDESFAEFSRSEAGDQLLAVQKLQYWFNTFQS